MCQAQSSAWLSRRLCARAQLLQRLVPHLEERREREEKERMAADRAAAIRAAAYEAQAGLGRRALQRSCASFEHKGGVSGRANACVLCMAAPDGCRCHSHAGQRATLLRHLTMGALELREEACHRHASGACRHGAHRPSTWVFPSQLAC